MPKSVIDVVHRGEANMRRKEVVGLKFDYVEVSVHATHFASSAISCLAVCFHPLKCYKPTDVSGDVRVVNPAVTWCLLHVYHTDSTKPLEETGQRTRSAARDISRSLSLSNTHTH